MTFDPEFKEALHSLPDSEKDKLILRLLKSNLNVANQLHFKLVDADSVQDKREQLKNQIIQFIQMESERYYSPGTLLMEARDISGQINEHVLITKDKLGEVSLNCTMLIQLLSLNNERIASETYGKAYTLCVYVVARVYKILMLMQKQHEDLHLEFEDDIVTIGKLIGRNPNLMRTAIYNGLDVNWLIQFEIPENIAGKVKDLREHGLLK